MPNRKVSKQQPSPQNKVGSQDRSDVQWGGRSHKLRERKTTKGKDSGII